MLFQGGLATPLMLARWRAKGALKGLSPSLTLTRDALATPEFDALWGDAFPSRDPLPAEPLHRSDGTMTPAFHRVWR